MTRNALLVFSLMTVWSGALSEPKHSSEPKGYYINASATKPSRCRVKPPPSFSFCSFQMFSALVPARGKKKKPQPPRLTKTLLGRCKTDISRCESAERHMKGIAGAPRRFTDCGFHHCSAFCSETRTPCTCGEHAFVSREGALSHLGSLVYFIKVFF